MFTLRVTRPFTVDVISYAGMYEDEVVPTSFRPGDVIECEDFDLTGADETEPPDLNLILADGRILPGLPLGWAVWDGTAPSRTIRVTRAVTGRFVSAANPDGPGEELPVKAGRLEVVRKVSRDRFLVEPGQYLLKLPAGSWKWAG